MICAAPSASSSSSFLGSSSAHPQVAVNPRHHSRPSAVTFRRPRPLTVVSASCAATVERPRVASSSSLYDVLGIPMGATSQEIKSAYRRLARLVHPDVAVFKPNNGSTTLTNCGADDFLKVHEAYSTLSDPGKRADYDRLLYGRSRPVRSPVATSSSGFSAGSTRRTWETDQCW